MCSNAGPRWSKTSSRTSACVRVAPSSKAHSNRLARAAREHDGDVRQRGQLVRRRSEHLGGGPSVARDDPPAGVVLVAGLGEGEARLGRHVGLPVSGRRAPAPSRVEGPEPDVVVVDEPDVRDEEIAERDRRQRRVGDRRPQLGERACPAGLVSRHLEARVAAPEQALEHVDVARHRFRGHGARSGRAALTRRDQELVIGEAYPRQDATASGEREDTDREDTEREQPAHDPAS